jgi:hypothetical protein
MTATPSRIDRILAILLAVAALTYVVYGFAAMAQWTPLTLYADQWRQYVTFLTIDFPANVVAPDNGHRQVLPNFVAWLDIVLLGGSHVLQLAVGWASVATAIALVAAVALRDDALAIAPRAAGVFLAAFAIIWLGNARTLAHTGELMHVYLTMALTLGGIVCALRAATARSHAWLATALMCGFAATNTFGYGLASFVGILAALVFAHAPRRLIVIAAAGLVLAALYYFGMRGGDSVSGSLRIDPLANLLAAARWLGGPLNYVAPYIWQEQAASLLPGVAHQPALALSAFLRTHVTGDIAAAVWPQALFGGAGIVVLLVASWRTLRADAAASRTRLTGLAIAWFGLAAAGIIALSRLGYFVDHPDQIYADRYQPWPCLFWLGVALVALGRRSTGASAWPRALAAGALALAIIAWPAERGGRIYASLIRGLVDNTAAGVATGVLGHDDSFGETLREELERGVPVIRDAQLPPFSWPETRALGPLLPDGARVLDGASINATQIANLFGGNGQRVEVVLGKGVKPPARAVLVDAQQHVVGIVVRDPRAGSANLTGYASAEAAPVAVAVLP